ncbi:heavy-metal-associated domain-containing protein [Teichococcus aestuarii]|uniref:HMA domain-containing protein n=1 Tax=Teichococcus aestuarii TaxID=568898 RepID=A0A2U1UYL2_9PROT|nr:hypothetical protein CR165_21490 [Pseudoroseomonas aestuarii]
MDALTAEAGTAAKAGDGAGVDIGIEEMSCASCVGRVEQALRRVPGVSDVSVNLSTERARVAFSGPPDTAALTKAVEGAGYDVPVAEFDLNVRGMTCASCSGRVERALKQVPGVVGAEVNPATERARVTTDMGAVTVDQLAAAVRDTGFDASPVKQVGTRPTLPTTTGSAFPSTRSTDRVPHGASSCPRS